MKLLLLTLLCLLFVTGAALAGPAGYWVVGADEGDLGPVFADFRITPHVVASLDEVPLTASSVLVLSGDYATPRKLSKADLTKLQRLAASGARIYVEYVQLPAGLALGGATFAKTTRLALHERLVVLKPLGGLPAETLLDEHDSRFMPFEHLPATITTWLEYDLALGTYRRSATLDQGRFSLTVDLGKVYTLKAIKQRYGAGRAGYVPDRVKLELSEDKHHFHEIAELHGPQPLFEAAFALHNQKARYVRLVLHKFKRSPVTDFCFMGELTVLDDAGANVALGQPYTTSPPSAGKYADNGRKLTDGVVDGLFSDGQSVGWATAPPLGVTHTPALVKIPWGKGELWLSATSLSPFARRNFRLAANWRKLWRGLITALAPPETRSQIAARYLPLEVHCEPRCWAVPGTKVKVVVKTQPGAQVQLHSQALGQLELQRTAPGEWQASFTAHKGAYHFEATAQTDSASATQTVDFECSPRREKYRRALEHNMRWFLRSGVLPKADGSAGVRSQVCLAWLESGHNDPFPFRSDCQAMTAQAFYLYWLVAGDAAFKQRALNLMQVALRVQYKDPSRASFGGFPWLLKDNSTLYFWDDNCRIATTLLWFYYWTGRREFLKGAVRAAELFRQVARKDTCVHRHAITREALDALGREAYRRFSQGDDRDYRLMHWWTLAAATGDAQYLALARECSRLWGEHSGPKGTAFAYYYAPTEALKRHAKAVADFYLNSQSFKRYGIPPLAPGYPTPFAGDCTITTAPDEPLSDQLYSTSWLFRAFVRLSKATGDADCKRLEEALGDYLVRIQYKSRDPRLDGCWMRGFDARHWEYYGAPYDPAYGPYAAYTGWMNAVISEALAWYLLDTPPFIPLAQTPREPEVVEAVKASSPHLVSEGPNLALHASYTLSPAPDPAYDDAGGELTDGVIDGHFRDGLSAGWHLSKGKTVRVRMRLDLGKVCTLKLITQRYGAGQGSYNPDQVSVWGSADGEEFSLLGRQAFKSEGAGLLWLELKAAQRVRYLLFELTKQCISPVTDFLFVGETEVYAPLALSSCKEK